MKEKFSKPLALFTALATGVLLAGAVAVPAIVHHIRKPRPLSTPLVYLHISQPQNNLVLLVCHACGQQWEPLCYHEILFGLDRNAFQVEDVDHYFGSFQPPFTDENGKPFPDVQIFCNVAKNQIVFEKTYESTVHGTPKPFTIRVYGDGRVEESLEGHIVSAQEATPNGMSATFGMWLEYEEEEKDPPSSP